MSTAKLYTPQVLGLAMELARWPLLPDAVAVGEARSPTCGSTIALGLRQDGAGRVTDFGMQVRACAIGQAAAALFGRSIVGRDAAEIGSALDAIAAWLAGERTLPDWPGLELLEPARDYPARHGAILLPWQAAMAALFPAPFPA
ncbi:iron-sulfur cluster assembly scaffold protein [Croceibacterium sp. TMG7-5b_MA50]|uniref:iron-sulfur cluster assembly scaffold protein n=1 Tax=Croceibacterium sp. TMG7-5b_MA50 TaxID=3121290 RepID=UPI0032215067